MHVKQRYDLDCAVPATAMLARTSYKKAWEALPYCPLKAGVTSHALKKGIKNLTNKTPKSTKLPYSPFSKVRFEKRRAIVFIYDPKRKSKVNGHFVYTDGHKLHDPDHVRPITMKYAKRNPYYRRWQVREIIFLD